jgi:hypothetical protein
LFLHSTMAELNHTDFCISSQYSSKDIFFFCRCVCLGKSRLVQIPETLIIDLNPKQKFARIWLVQKLSLLPLCAWYATHLS